VNLTEIADLWCKFDEELLKLDTCGLDWWAFLQCLLGLTGDAFEKLRNCKTFVSNYNQFIRTQDALKPKVVDGFATDELIAFLTPIAFEVVAKMIAQEGRPILISKWANTPEGKYDSIQRARIIKAINYFIRVTEKVDRRVSEATIKRHEKAIEALISQRDELLNLCRDVQDDDDVKADGVTIMMEPYVSDDGRNTMMEFCDTAVKEAMTDQDAFRSFVTARRDENGSLDALVKAYTVKLPVPTRFAKEEVDRDVYAETVAVKILREVNAVVLKEVEEERKKKEAQLARKRKALETARARAEQAKQARAERAITRSESLDREFISQRVKRQHEHSSYKS